MEAESGLQSRRERPSRPLPRSTHHATPLLMSYLDYEYYGNHVRVWLVALAVLAGLFTLLVVARRIAIGRLASFAERTQTDLDDLGVELIRRTRYFFLFAVSLSAASLALAVPDG